MTSIVIPLGETDSEPVPPIYLSPATRVLIMAPAVLSEVVNFCVSDGLAQPFVVLKINALSVVVPEDAAIQIAVLNGCFWKLRSTTPVGADRVFRYLVNRIGDFHLP